MMAVALAATLGYFLVTVVLSPMKLAPIRMKARNQSAFEKMNNGNVFVGIVIGFAAYAYNSLVKQNYH